METEEQSMIREMVRSFAEEVLAPTCLERDRAAKPPLDEWQKFCEYGLQGITIQEKYGGSPVDDISEAIIIEELARVDPSFAVMYCVHVGLCSKTIEIHGNEEQKQKYLTRLAGNEIGAYSRSEAGAGTERFASAHLKTRPVVSSDTHKRSGNGEAVGRPDSAASVILVLS